MSRRRSSSSADAASSNASTSASEQTTSNNSWSCCNSGWAAPSPSPPPATPSSSTGLERVYALACQSAVVVFSHSGCCMCHVAKRLLSSLGVGPAVYELDEEGDAGAAVQQALEMLLAPDGKPPVPAVFIGGKLLGGLDSLMAAHIAGELVPLLKEAGALWL